MIFRFSRPTTAFCLRRSLPGLSGLPVVSGVPSLSWMGIAVSLLLGTLSMSPLLYGQPGGTFSRGIPVPSLAPEEAEPFLERLRAQRLPNDFVFRFAFIHFPSRGERVNYAGDLWGSWDDNGPLLRAILQREAVSMEREAGAPVEFLLHGGVEPEVWRKSFFDGVSPLSAADWERPLLDGLVYTAFDLGLPFVYWPDATYLRSFRFRGRPVHFFEARPPADQTVMIGGRTVERVEMAIDADFMALSRARVFGDGDRLLRTISVNDFVRLSSGNYIVGSIDVTDQATRDRTRFEVRAAQDQIRLDPALFDPARLLTSSPRTEGLALERL